MPVWAGDTVLLGAGDHGDGRVASWRAGASRLTVLPGRIADFDPNPTTFLLLT